MSQEFCGGCCHDIQIELTEDEAEHLWMAGSDIEAILPIMPKGETGWSSLRGEALIIERVREERQAGNMDQVDFWFGVGRVARHMDPDTGLFQLTGACGNLGDDGRCEIYLDQPRHCQGFPIGSTACQVLRSNELNAMLGAESETEVSIRR